MIPRSRATAAGALAVALAVALAACGSADPTTSQTTTAPPSAAGTAADVTCTTSFAGGNGISVYAGQVTGTLGLSCTGIPDQVDLSLILFYRPNSTVATTDAASASESADNAMYQVSADCQAGLWYLGVAGTAGDVGASLDLSRGDTVTVTADQCD
jgi:hypothetical protein